MKISYQTILSVAPALKELSQVKMPGSVALRVARALKLFSAEFQTYQDTRVSLAQTLGKLSPDGTSYTFEDQGFEFNLQLTQMLSEEVEMTVPSIDEAELAGIEITPEYLLPLLGVIINV